jgi:hypothetical protein
MTQENTVRTEQSQAKARMEARSEAEELVNAKEELSELLDQVDQTKAEVKMALALIHCLGERARKAADDCGVADDLDEAQTALRSAYRWVNASLAWLDKPDDPDKPKRERDRVSAALTTLHRAGHRLRGPGVNLPRLEMRLIELAEFFDMAGEIVRNLPKK